MVKEKGGRRREHTSALGDGDVIYRLFKVLKVSLVELCPEAVRHGAHPLEEKGNAVEVDLVAFDHGVDARGGDEGVIDAETAGETGAAGLGRTPGAELTA